MGAVYDFMPPVYPVPKGSRLDGRLLCLYAIHAIYAIMPPVYPAPEGSRLNGRQLCFYVAGLPRP